MKKSSNSKKNETLKVASIKKIANRDEAKSIARIALRPAVQAAFTMKYFGPGYHELPLRSLADALQEQVDAASNGATNRAEELMLAQAHTLDAIFNNLASRAVGTEHLEMLERYLKLALRAQSQCRATLETLAVIKNPHVAGHIHQTNIAHGPQQVNNAPAKPGGSLPNGESRILQNKLLEENDGERLDPGTTRTSGPVDSAMATLGTVDRATDRDR